MKLSADGIDFEIFFEHYGPVTTCIVIWTTHGRTHVTGGYAICNPKDIFDPVVGERMAMKRVCQHYVFGKSLYHAYRKLMYEAKKSGRQA